MSTKIGQILQRTNELLDVFDNIGENLLVGGGTNNVAGLVRTRPQQDRGFEPDRASSRLHNGPPS
jgi:hypothetical protein